MIRRSLVASRLAIALASAGCGVRAAPQLDVTALVATHGAEGARLALLARIADDPRDVSARLALAAHADGAARPGEAIEQLAAVVAISGPAGTRWRGSDRARFARLLAARGRARVARGAPTGRPDLERARDLGAMIDPGLFAEADRLAAVVQLGHPDAGERAAGRATLLALATRAGADPAWRGAHPGAPAAAHGALGQYLWVRGARRGAWEELAAWRDGTPAPRDPALAALYVAAYAWWTPYDGPPPRDEDLVGPDRCRWPRAGCVPGLAATTADAALLATPAMVAPVAPTAVAGWLAITLRAALRGEGAWGPMLRARVDATSVRSAALAPAFRGAYAALVEPAAPASERADGSPDLASDDARLVFAGGLTLRGASRAEVEVVLGSLAPTPAGRALLAIATPASAARGPLTLGDARLGALVARVQTRVTTGPAPALIDAIARQFLVDPLIADRLGRELVARSPDAAVAHATLGAIFDALRDPARARTAWQAAVDASPEPGYLRALAEAIARARDPDAALVAAVAAAAASGDPAIVWITVARALTAETHYVHALEASRFAIDLAGADAIADALDVAIAASAGMGRTAQVAELRTRRAGVGPPVMAPSDDDPTDVDAALSAARAAATPATLGRLWWATRWNPRAVAPRAGLLAALPEADPRRTLLLSELVTLAGDSRVGDAALAVLTAAR